MAGRDNLIPYIIRPEVAEIEANLQKLKGPYEATTNTLDLAYATLHLWRIMSACKLAQEKVERW